MHAKPKLNSFCGTAAYLAPEMIQKKGHDASIDWYLLGVFMYELLVGLPPYFDNEKEIMFENIKRGPLKLPRTLSKHARDLILKVSYFIEREVTYQRPIIKTWVNQRWRRNKIAPMVLQYRLGSTLPK